LRKASAISATAAAILLLSMQSALAGDTSANYTLTNTVALGAPERWDYVVYDPASGRVYVAHGPKVSVVDAKKGTVIGTVGDFPGGSHGIGISTATRTGYTDDGKAGVAIPFDLATLKTAAPIPTAPDADGVVFDPASNHMLIINGDSGSVTVIDPATNRSLATIQTGGGLEFGLVDGQGKFFVDGAEKGEIVRIDTSTNAVDAHWPMPGCVKPHGIAMDMSTRRIFASCANQVMVVVDADKGTNVATIPIGSYTDFAAFDPVRKLAFSSNGDGTLSVIQEKDANTFVALPPIKTAVSARTMAIDPKSGRLFLAAADVAKIDPPATPGGRPHVQFVPGSLKLLVFDPSP
jgi:YVTN family beta-propeller protein